ncbi:MAG: ABC-ATPase domain-containing protein [Candidatus Latescibacteria bacterium]|nr:ABC-ATPase domain-containing protein [Candidatus Latescibacterota bacterium]
MTNLHPTVASCEDLAVALRQLDGRGFKAYRDLELTEGFGFAGSVPFHLSIDYVQADPFAPPSRLTLSIPRTATGVPDHLLQDTHRRRGLCHGLALAIAHATGQITQDRSDLQIDRPRQQILDRSCVQWVGDELIIRLSARLPAAGRRIQGHQAAHLLCERLPAVLQAGVIYEHLDAQHLQQLATCAADGDALRGQLADHDLVAFVADGSRLPRHSGIDDRPLQSHAISWQSPPSLRVELEQADGTRITGTGIRRGVTAIVGGGFHGKSTLLDALRMGVYEHVPGDGREGVVCDETAVSIRAEDGRRISGVDLSPFIGPLPQGRRTDHFTSDDASGSTSQAAAIVEALEIGSRLLLIDEDTAATNFMIRDQRMRQLIGDQQEPITPFIDRVGQLAATGTSTIVVTGGSSDYLSVAGTVIAMEEYRPVDVTERAHELVPLTGNTVGAWPATRGRIPLPQSLNPRRGRRERSVRARTRHELEVGRTFLDLSALGQLVDQSQTRALGQALLHIHHHYLGEHLDVAQICAAVLDDIRSEGWSVLTQDRFQPDLAQFRAFELSATLNRLRTLQVEPAPGAVA